MKYDTLEVQTNELGDHLIVVNMWEKIKNVDVLALWRMKSCRLVSLLSCMMLAILLIVLILLGRF